MVDPLGESTRRWIALMAPLRAHFGRLFDCEPTFHCRPDGSMRATGGGRSVEWTAQQVRDFADCHDA